MTSQDRSWRNAEYDRLTQKIQKEVEHYDRRVNLITDTLNEIWKIERHYKTVIDKLKKQIADLKESRDPRRHGVQRKIRELEEELKYAEKLRDAEIQIWKDRMDKAWK